MNVFLKNADYRRFSVASFLSGAGDILFYLAFMTYASNLHNKRNKYSIRKLSVGAVSALIGVSFFGFSSQVVSADTGINTADNSSNGHNNPATDSDTWQIGSQNTKEYDGKETNKIDVNKFSLSDGDKKLNTSSINNVAFNGLIKMVMLL